MKTAKRTKRARVDPKKSDAWERQEIVREILRYFIRRPAAKDTLEGIARWWLDRQRVERSVDEVAESLRILVARGLILERRGRAERPYYQVNPAKQTEIADFLAGDGGASSRDTTCVMATEKG